MSTKERDRIKVLHEVKKRHITQKQAALELGLSVRWVRKLLVRLGARGDVALRHGLRGRRSNRKMPEAVKRRAVELYRQKKQAKLWHDYGPTLAVEELAEQHGIAISRETLRVELTFDTPPSVPDKVPAEWMQLNSSAAVLHFVDSRFDQERTGAQIRNVFGEVRNVTFTSMSLRSIFLAMAKTGRDER